MSCGTFRQNLGVTQLPDGSGFFVMDVDTSSDRPSPDPIIWNPFNKVVQDHRDGTIDMSATNRERALRGLSVPWTIELADVEVHQGPVF